MNNLIFSLNATIPIFLVMVIGYVLKNLKFVDEPFVKTLNTFNYKVTLPVLLFRDIALVWQILIPPPTVIPSDSYQQ